MPLCQKKWGQRTVPIYLSLTLGVHSSRFLPTSPLRRAASGKTTLPSGPRRCARLTTKSRRPSTRSTRVFSQPPSSIDLTSHPLLAFRAAKQHPSRHNNKHVTEFSADGEAPMRKLTLALIVPCCYRRAPPG